MDIVNRTENKLLNRVEIEFKWSHKGSKTPFEEGYYGSRENARTRLKPRFHRRQELQDSVWTSAHNRSGVDLREC